MTAAMDQLQRALAGVPLFAGLTNGQLAGLARFASTRRFKPGTVIVHQGDTSMAFYIVLAGSVRIERESPRGSPVVGEEGPGGFFGEMGLIDDLPRAATVVALEPCECALLVKWDFESELRRDPHIALALLRALTARIRTLDGCLAELERAGSGSG